MKTEKKVKLQYKDAEIAIKGKMKESNISLCIKLRTIPAGSNSNRGYSSGMCCR